MPLSSAPLLRLGLALNLVFSLSCGVAALLAGAQIADAMGALPAWLVSAIGGGLILFAAGIGWTLWRLRIGQALAISGLDLLWVIGTVPLTLVPGLFSATGVTIALLVAAAVGTLALVQLAGIRALLRHGAPAGQLRHCIRVRSAVAPKPLWRIVRDLGGIAQYSASLQASRLEGEGAPAPGHVRVCTNLRGQSWAEEVVALDDSARSVAFRFRAEAADFPFPLAALSGGWQVLPGSDGGSLVDVWWTVTPKQRRFGWLLLAAMTIPMDRDVPAMVGAMEAAAQDQPLPRKAVRPTLGYC